MTEVGMKSSKTAYASAPEDKALTLKDIEDLCVRSRALGMTDETVVRGRGLLGVPIPVRFLLLEDVQPIVQDEQPDGGE